MNYLISLNIGLSHQNIQIPKWSLVHFKLRSASQRHTYIKNSLNHISQTWLAIMKNITWHPSSNGIHYTNNDDKHKNFWYVYVCISNQAVLCPLIGRLPFSFRLCDLARSNRVSSRYVPLNNVSSKQSALWWYKQ